MATEIKDTPVPILDEDGNELHDDEIVTIWGRRIVGQLVTLQALDRAKLTFNDSDGLKVEYKGHLDVDFEHKTPQYNEDGFAQDFMVLDEDNEWHFWQHCVTYKTYKFFLENNTPYRGSNTIHDQLRDAYRPCNT